MDIFSSWTREGHSIVNSTCTTVTGQSENVGVPSCITRSKIKVNCSITYNYADIHRQGESIIHYYSLLIFVYKCVIG